MGTSHSLINKKKKVILKVDEENASHVCYQLSKEYVPLLEKINNRRYEFHQNAIGITNLKTGMLCEPVSYESEIAQFVKLFKHGFYINDWKNVANILECKGNNLSNPLPCKYDYIIYF